MSESMRKLHKEGSDNKAIKHIEGAPDSSKQPLIAVNGPTVDLAPPWDTSALPNQIGEWAPSVAPSVDTCILQ